MGASIGGTSHLQHELRLGLREHRLYVGGHLPLLQLVAGGALAHVRAPRQQQGLLQTGVGALELLQGEEWGSVRFVTPRKRGARTREGGRERGGERESVCVCAASPPRPLQSALEP
jgi:hypothetical protein